MQSDVGILVDVTVVDDGCSLLSLLLDGAIEVGLSLSALSAAACAAWAAAAKFAASKTEATVVVRFIPLGAESIDDVIGVAVAEEQQDGSISRPAAICSSTV